MDAGEDLALQNDFRARRHVEVFDTALGKPVRLPEQPADDVVFAHVGRIGVDHGAHVVQRVRADDDGSGQRMPSRLGPAVEFVHAPPRMQRDPEPVLAFQHQAMEAGGVDPRFRIARRHLPGGDVGRRIDGELERNGQTCEIDIVAFQHDIVPSGLRDDFRRDVCLAALAKRRRQVRDGRVETAGQERAVAGHVRDDRHVEVVDLFEDHDRALVETIEFEHGGRHVEVRADALFYAQNVGRIGLFGRFHKAA